MPITPEHAGRSYPATPPYEVSAVKVAEFARALGGDPSQGVPPTFAIVVAAQAWESMFGDPELGLALHRIVHGDQKFSWQRPLRTGDTVTATLRIEQVRERGGMQMITSSVAIATMDDEPIGTAVATFVHTPEPVA